MPEHIQNRKEIYRWIVQRTPPQGRVLDIGCGDGELLARLVRERDVHGTGIEISESCVMRAVQRGLSVHHGNVEEGLDHYSDQSFDLVIMALTLQELSDPKTIIHEALRVGKTGAFVFPNFGYFSARWQLAVRGRAPCTAGLPYSWHDSPNRHFFTVSDWDQLCRAENWHTLDRSFITAGKAIRFLPNLRAEVALYLLEKK